MLDDLDIKKLVIAVLFSALHTEKASFDETVKRAFLVYNEIHKKEMERYNK